MAYVKWAFIIIFWGTIAVILQYSLPQHDIVRIVNTYEERQDLNDWTRIFWSEPEDQSTSLSNRDVQFIQAVRANGKPIVYRNEDTGWGWPPYFKFDTANLYTEANDAKSTKENPKWVVVTHYGWRNEFMSIFPNAIFIKDVEGPDVRIIPWFNIIFLTIFAAFVWAIWVRWRRFRQARIDPMIENVEDGLYAAGDAIEERHNRFRRWLDSWKSK
ncbi:MULTISPECIES: DUF1523 family protein [Ruegeria]|jgi:hypothetical protein|uniref:DUF1523 family protein n=1 Tax=Ruegeria TaxID=97050 RepID=UPI001268389C|nr:MULTISPECIES: DUF1523 family protein [Ruegeria]MCA0907804.1 DUF1523 family protein [Ruegeria marisrubri]NOC85453.1 DUF1523 family protein [Ruegeria sp. HKCCD6428]NOE27941.1 DUF1523 family protein [Ruegeria sp. HKCCD6157]QFT74774.1 hypothetical protein FIU92_17190 [Ruegeria sp. THAF33]